VKNSRLFRRKLQNMKIILEETTIPVLYKQGKMRRVQVMDGELTPSSDKVVCLFVSCMLAYGFSEEDAKDAMRRYITDGKADDEDRNC